jgi:hypothetical protein
VRTTTAEPLAHAPIGGEVQRQGPREIVFDVSMQNVAPSDTQLELL